ncbi:YpoC family protein [Sutcliffiella cohnii]
MDITVPTSFQREPFYKTGDTITTSEQWNGLFIDLPSFYFNITKQQSNINSEWLIKLFEEWKVEKRKVQTLFKEKNGEYISNVMRKFIAHFTEVLFWINDEVILDLHVLGDSISLFKWQPINSSERLEYIIAHYKKYHAWIQLSELYTELEKLYYKKRQLVKEPKST